LTQPLRSIPLSGTSSLLQVVPSLSLRFRTLALVVLPLAASPLASKSQVPTFRLTASLARSGHLSCRMPLRPYSGFVGAWSRSNDSPAVLTSSLRFRHFNSGSLAVLLLACHLTWSLPGLFLPRSRPWLLTTAAEGGLKPAPVSRFRGAFPHRLSSCALLGLTAIRARGTRSSA